MSNKQHVSKLILQVLFLELALKQVPKRAAITQHPNCYKCLSSADVHSGSGQVRKHEWEAAFAPPQEADTQEARKLPFHVEHIFIFYTNTKYLNKCSISNFPPSIYGRVYFCAWRTVCYLRGDLKRRIFHWRDQGEGGREFKGDTKGTRESGWPGAPYYQDQDSYSFIQLPTATWGADTRIQ